ncbi:MAG: hypothetical protein CBE00_04855 [Planctomycetaceae bacterium TMED240]|nr:hypothetical protein [Rhodopirellula sp.]OUX07549.1 MAG: hypothetical protein CBE00_04855 [Planctomycetaceae bacterium TMED240]
MCLRELVNQVGKGSRQEPHVAAEKYLAAPFYWVLRQVKGVPMKRALMVFIWESAKYSGTCVKNLADPLALCRVPE